jgi:hypothetical protein
MESLLNSIFSAMEQVKTFLEEILDRMTDEFNIAELMAKVEERTPYIVVALQECERMNILTREIQRSLRELHLGLQVSKRDIAGGHGWTPQGQSDRQPRARALKGNFSKAIQMPESYHYTEARLAMGTSERMSIVFSSCSMESSMSVGNDLHASTLTSLVKELSSLAGRPAQW